MTERFLVAGVGNLLRSDDGFGCEVALRLQDRPVAPDVRIVDYGIRGVHLALDIGDHLDALVVVDTVPDAGGVGQLTVLAVDPVAGDTNGFDAHAMDPGSVFAAIGALTRSVPPCFVVGCQPACLDDGIGLSDPVAAAVPRAVAQVEQLLDRLRRSPSGCRDERDSVPRPVLQKGI